MRKHALEKTPNLLLENLWGKDLACESGIQSHLSRSQEQRYWYPEKICGRPPWHWLRCPWIAQEADRCQEFYSSRDIASLDQKRQRRDELEKEQFWEQSHGCTGWADSSFPGYRAGLPPEQDQRTVSLHLASVTQEASDLDFDEKRQEQWSVLQGRTNRGN